MGKPIIRESPLPDPMHLPEDFLIQCVHCGKIIHPKTHETSRINQETKVKEIHRGLHCPKCFINLTKSP